ncbi:MAG: hypothetical protein O2958_02685 [Gemmatimonadetes bacterium]|nr:hypothetical protein [Gemmatimonadota bacterium]
MSRGLRFALGASLLVATVQPVSAQYVIGGGVDYVGYTFDAGLGADAAQLFMIPVAVRIPVSDALTFDLFGAWAEGRVEQENTVLTLAGPVDASIKASYQATPWALVSIGANIPTGNATHTNEEAIVASVLSTDLLGFREATWGTGLAFTTSVATAATAGGFGLGIAAAYAVRGEFEPSADDPLKYQPGTETRVRLGVDRNFGNSTFTAGASFINYTEDKANKENLFQAGNRLRFDATFAFRAGAGIWTIYGANLMRENGDLRLDVIDELGQLVGQETITTAKQNMIVGGLMGTVGLGGGFVFRPHLDYKMQTREEEDGNEAGSGWILAAGGDIPLRIFGGYDFFPKARVFFGSLQDAAGGNISLLGMEFKGTMRWAF